MSLAKRHTLPPRREREAGEFASYTPRPRAPARMVTVADTALPAVAPILKTTDRVQQAIRDSARGEDCTVRIPGGCSFDREKTIWSHAPLGAAGKGRSLKAIDLCGAYACTCCDAIVDMQAPAPSGITRGEILIAWFYGHMRSLVRLRQKGLV